MPSHLLDHSLADIEARLADLGRAGVPRAPGRALGAAPLRDLVRGDDGPAGRPAHPARRGVDARRAAGPRGDARRRRRDLEGAAGPWRRGRHRGGADGLRPGPPGARRGVAGAQHRLRLDAGGMRDGLRLLRDRAAGLHAQPDGGRDPRPGAALPASAPDLQRRLHGHGRAARQLRPHARRRALADRPRRPRPARPRRHDLDRGPAGPDPPPRGRAATDRPHGLVARTRRRAASPPDPHRRGRHARRADRGLERLRGAHRPPRDVRLRAARAAQRQAGAGAPPGEPHPRDALPREPDSRTTRRPARACAVPRSRACAPSSASCRPPASTPPSASSAASRSPPPAANYARTTSRRPRADRSHRGWALRRYSSSTSTRAAPSSWARRTSNV